MPYSSANHLRKIGALTDQISALFLSFSAVEASSVLFKLKQVSTFKENLPVFPLDCGFTHIMKCSCSESASLCNLVMCKAIPDSENGEGWKGPLEVILSKLGQAQLEGVAQDCQMAFKYLQRW